MQMFTSRCLHSIYEWKRCTKGILGWAHTWVPLQLGCATLDKFFSPSGPLILHL